RASGRRRPPARSVSSSCPRSGSGRNSEYLARMDQVGIGDLVAVGFVDGLPLLRVPVLPLGDLREAVSRNHGIGALGRRGRLGGWRRRGGRRAPALDIGEICARLFFLAAEEFV